MVHPNAGKSGASKGMSGMFETSFGLKEVGAEKLTDAIAQTEKQQQELEQEGDEKVAKEKEKNDAEEQLNKPEYDPSRSIHSFEIKPLERRKSETAVSPRKSRIPSFRRVRFHQRYGESKLKRALETDDENSSVPGEVAFENVRQRSAGSGIIVLPCGAGKSLTGIAAAVRVGKSCLCLCTSSVSVDQWAGQFKLWTNLTDREIVRFTSQNKETFLEQLSVRVRDHVQHDFCGWETFRSFGKDSQRDTWSRVGDDAPGRSPRCPCGDVSKSYRHHKSAL